MEFNRKLKQAGRVAAVLSVLSLTALPRSEVRGQTPETEMDTETLGDLLVTASRTEEAAINVPANTTIITADDIANTTATNVPEVLRYMAGVQVSSWSGSGRKSNVDVRGFGETAAANTLVLVDGRRINAADLSGIDWTTIPLERIARIEVVRGSGSVTYGDNAVGGVINIITKKGAETNQLTAETRLESYQTFNQHLGISGSSDNWTYNVSGSYHDGDGYRDNGYFRNKDAGLSLSYDNNSFWFIDLNAGIKDDRFGLPGPVREGQDRTDTNTPWDYVETEQHYLQLEPTIRLSDSTSLSLGLSYRKYEQFTFTVSDYMGTLYENTYETNLYEHGISPKLHIDQKIFGLPHSLVGGIDYYSSDLHYLDSISPMGDRHRHEAGYYFQDRIEVVRNVTLSLGYRRSRVNYDFELSEDATHNLDSVNAGLTYNYAPGSKVFAGFDRAYRTMLLDELGGSSLPADEPIDPQISKHYQAGIKHSFGDKLTLAATIFQIDTENEIFFDPYVTFAWGSWSGENSNYEETRRRGIELELEARPHDKVRVFANYTYMDPELQGGDYDENEIPGVAKHTGSIGVTVFPTDKLTVDIRSRWSEDKTLISDWQNTVDDWDGDYFVVDALLSYELKPFTFYAGVNNLFAREYSEYGVYTPDYGTYPATYYNAIYPSPERNFIAGVKLTKKF